MAIEEPIIDLTCCRTRPIADKLADIISVKDFGAKGDGVTDDTQAIKDAIAYACGRSLVFPHGTYLLSSQDTFARQVFVQLTGNIKIIGHNATLKCGITGTCNATPCAAGSMMELVNIASDTIGYDVDISGLNFDGNNKSVYGLICRERAYRKSSVKIEHCSFVNMFSPKPWVDVTPSTTDDSPGDSFGGVGPNGLYRESTGLHLYGAWKNVIVDSCFVKNINRALGAGRFGFFGSCGITVTSYGLQDGSYIPPQNTTITNCHIENILNSETSPNSSSNVDCDGLKIFGGAGFDTLNTYPDTRATVYGNHFVNCKGRDIKAQIEEIVIQNNTSYMNITPIQNGGARVNVQISSGIVSNNVFHFDPTSTNQSSFVADGGTGGEDGQGSVISFHDGALENRQRSINIENNHIYLNVSPSSKLRNVIDCTQTGSVCQSGCCENELGLPSSGCSGGAVPSPGCKCSNVWTQRGYATIRGNKVLGIGKARFFAEISTRVAGGTFYYTFEDNMFMNVETAFLASNGNGNWDFDKISAINNVHAGPLIKHFVASWDKPPTAVAPGPYQLYSANISAFNNKNIGLTDANTSSPNFPLGFNHPRSFTPKFNFIGYEDGTNGGIRIDTALPPSGGGTLQANTTYNFRADSSLGLNAGKLHLLIGGSSNQAVALFFSSIGTIIPIFTGTSFTVGTGGTEPTSGSVKIWSSADAGINFKTSSSSTTYTLYSFIA
jgi:hypothetical protein